MEPARRRLLAAPEVVVAQEYAALAIQRFAPGTPTVFGFSGDPLQAKLVKSLARPDTNFSGVSYLASELVVKRIEFLKEALPGTRRIGILARPQHPGEPEDRRASKTAAMRWWGSPTSSCTATASTSRSSREIYRTLATYVDRVLRGAKVGDLPVDRPRTVELVVNLRTARALAVTVALTVMLRVDRVIE